MGNSIYQKLQDLCNRQIDDEQWKPRGDSERSIIGEIEAFQGGIVIGGEDCYSYHELFSVESGFLETLDWKPTMSFGEGNLRVRYNTMSMMTAKEKIEYVLSNIIDADAYIP